MNSDIKELTEACGLKPSIALLLEALNNAYDDEPQMLAEMGFDEPFSELLEKIKWSQQ